MNNKTNTRQQMKQQSAKKHNNKTAHSNGSLSLLKSSWKIIGVIGVLLGIISSFIAIKNCCNKTDENNPATVNKQIYNVTDSATINQVSGDNVIGDDNTKIGNGNTIINSFNRENKK
jgi:hypothetical protein